MTIQVTSARSLWRGLAWAPAAICLIAIVYLRANAENMDFGMVNVLTYLLAMAMWIATIAALGFSSGTRSAVVVLLVPIVLGGLFFAFYRLERFDSEINPRFVSRWQPYSELPVAASSGGSKSGSAEAGATAASPLSDNFFATRSTDFPEFLGPERDATLPQQQLKTNWQQDPPRIAWKQPIGQGWSGFAVQGDAAYTLEQRDQTEWVTCYNANTGQLLWHFEMPGMHTHPLGGTGPRSTPTVRNGKVYAMSAVSELVCLDLRSGEKIWSAGLNELAGVTKEVFEKEVSWGRSASPLVVAGKVIVPLGGSADMSLQSLIALDADTGQELWRGGSDQISYATPVLASLLGQPQILIVSQSLLSAHSLETGAELWSVAWPGHSNSDASVSQPIVIDDAHVLMSKGYGGGAQLLEISKSDAAWETTVKWQSSAVLKTKFTSCVVYRDHAFALSDGILECVDVWTGKRAWKQGRYRHGQVLLVGDTLLVTTEAGEIVLVAADPEKHRELASLAVIGDVSWNTAALSGNRLLMRNSNEAACVLLPLRDVDQAEDTTGSETTADSPSSSGGPTAAKGTDEHQ